MIRISLTRRVESLNTELYVYDKNEAGITNYYPDESGSIVGTFVSREESFKNAIVLKPFASLPDPTMRELVHAFVEYAREEGIKGGEESHAKGKLEATEKHLEDMRKLVFEPRKKFVITTDASLSGVEL